MTEEEKKLFENLNQQLNTTNKILYSQHKLLQEIKQKNDELEKYTEMIDKRIADWQTAKLFWILTLILVAIIILLNIYPYIGTWIEQWRMEQELNASIHDTFKNYYR